MAKPKWEVKVVKEVATSDHVMWKAQVSSSPDGTKFVGLRKFAIRNGEEVVTKDGISLKLGDHTKDELAALSDLLAALQASAMPKKEPRIVLWSAVHKGALVKVRNGIGVSSSQVKGEPKVFKTVKAAKLFREQHLGDDETRWLACDFAQKTGKKPKK